MHFSSTIKSAGLVLLSMLVLLPIGGGETVLTISPQADVRAIPPGVVGWGAMWRSDLLFPPPPATMNDETHQQYIDWLGHRNAAVVQAADMRNISWPWGVSFSTWAVNWENSVGPWSQRTPDCVIILNRGSSWCEKTVVGVGDLMTLADIWQLEAITVSVPLAVIDGSSLAGDRVSLIMCSPRRPSS